MSTVSLSSSQTFRPCDSSECDEEGSCSDGGDIAGYEYLSNKCSIDFDLESEAAMSENDECVGAEISPSFRFMAGAADRRAQQGIHRRAQQGIHRRAQQYANMFLADPTTSESSWTDEKHSLYLNSIEEAFVKRLHERGHYSYSCKRWEAERMIPCVSGKGLYEDVESGFSYDYQPFLFPEENGTETQRRCSHEDVQNRRKQSRMEDIYIKQLGLQEEDINEKGNNCQSEKQPLGEGSTERGDESNESSPKIQMQCFKDTSKHDHGGRDTETSERYMQEDQVVPSMENTSEGSS